MHKIFDGISLYICEKLRLENMGISLYNKDS